MASRYTMKTADLRKAFLAFYESKEHRIVPSSSLVPNNDPTLLFTNAGMNQFKDPLLGKSDPGYTRATSAQRCVRAGGNRCGRHSIWVAWAIFLVSRSSRCGQGT